MDNGTARIYDCNPSGTVQIVDTMWDGNGALRVTVREMIGEVDPPACRDRKSVV